MLDWYVKEMNADDALHLANKPTEKHVIIGTVLYMKSNTDRFVVFERSLFFC